MQFKRMGLADGFAIICSGGKEHMAEARQKVTVEWQLHCTGIERKHTLSGKE